MSDEIQVEPEKCARSYRMGQRQEAMDETRARVLEAARALIVGENALAGFSMEGVAKQAGVTRATIYNRFTSRRGLLEALFDEVGARGQLAERLPEVFARVDAREALRDYVALFCEFWESERALNRRLRGFAALDEEFAAAIATRTKRRRYAIENLLRRLDGSADEARVQTVLALTGFEFYDALAKERGAAEVAPLLFDLVMSALGLPS